MVSCRAVAMLAVAVAGVLATLRPAAAATRICLTAIVKNEEKDILRCLHSAAPELSGWVVCDTGSTDDTPALVEGFFKGARVPGQLLHHAWTNFATNRNLCLEAGLAWSLQRAQQLGLPAGQHFCAYMLLLDADQVLHPPVGGKPGDLKALSNLTHDAYFMLERRGVSWNEMRMTSTAVPWRWGAEVHEYLYRADGKAIGEQHVLPGWWTEHEADADGGRRYTKDLEVLLKAVAADPKDARSQYYLAGTYRALGDDEAAVEHFIERIRLGGDQEERFMAALYIAEAAKQQYSDGELVSSQIKTLVGNWDGAVSRLSAQEEAREEELLLAAEEEDEEAPDAPPASNRTAVLGGRSSPVEEARKAREFHWVVAAYNAAMQILPSRPEPWSRLARLFLHEKADFERCWSYTAAGLAQGPSPASALFLDTYASQYELRDLACTCGYYVERVLEQGKGACRELEQQALQGLQEFPDNSVLTDLLERARGSIGWYERNQGVGTASPSQTSAARTAAASTSGGTLL